ncbi:MAG: hypothetical protein QM796_17165 [Chthoniobacteraceae bacterium]
MKTLPVLIAAALFTLQPMLHAGPNTYQVTGPVLAVTDTTITVQKGKDPWEIARTPATKITGDLKVGAKVTIQYTMTAVSVDVKPAKATK